MLDDVHRYCGYETPFIYHYVTSKSRSLRIVLGILDLGTMKAMLTPAKMQPAPGPSADTFGNISVILSLAANIVSTSLVAVKAWYEIHR